MVSTSLLKDEQIWTTGKEQDVAKYFVEIGERGAVSQSSTSAIDRNGVMFFTQVHRDDVACWNTANQYSTSNIKRVFETSAGTNPLIQFPNDIKVDREYPVQNVWVISNRLPVYLYSQLNFTEINFRVLKGSVNQLISGTVCDQSAVDGYHYY